MATVAIPARDILLREKLDVTAALARIGIDYERGRSIVLDRMLARTPCLRPMPRRLRR